jgi:hypothetical protein
MADWLIISILSQLSLTAQTEPLVKVERSACRRIALNHLVFFLNPYDVRFVVGFRQSLALLRNDICDFAAAKPPFSKEVARAA